MSFMLLTTYLTGPEAGEGEAVGPFPTKEDAISHQESFGPYSAEVVESSTVAGVTPLMSPKEHAAYSAPRY
jgi:hypothetical protein